jgi:hypothetical protein
MVGLIKKSSLFLARLAFFVIFIIGIDPENLFDPAILGMAFLKGCCAYVLFRLAGLVLADIIFKGIVYEMQENKFDEIEGGLLQRFQEARKAHTLNPVDENAEAAKAVPEKKLSK